MVTGEGGPWKRRSPASSLPSHIGGRRSARVAAGRRSRRQAGDPVCDLDGRDRRGVRHVRDLPIPPPRLSRRRREGVAPPVNRPIHLRDFKGWFGDSERCGEETGCGLRSRVPRRRRNIRRLPIRRDIGRGARVLAVLIFAALVALLRHNTPPALRVSPKF